MSFKPETITWIQRAIFFGEEIRRLFANIKEPAQLTPPLQNALMFCLKAIGTCIDKAAKAENIDLEQNLRPEQKRPYDTLVFWKSLHHLRNNLIHHFDQNMLHDFILCKDILNKDKDSELSLLFNICKNAGHVVFYLQLIASQQKTSVDLGEQRFKVFVDVHELARLLAIHNSREIRTQIPQFQYLQAMTDAIAIIFKHIVPNIENTSIGILGTEKYYALQNILECIATLGNPNALGATQRINDQSREAIFSVAPQADGWLRGLGQSRIKALHESKLMNISGEEVHLHLGNLQLLHQVLLEPKLAKTLNKKLEDKFGVFVPSGTPPAANPLSL